jgi:hypothetical protein
MILVPHGKCVSKAQFQIQMSRRLPFRKKKKQKKEPVEPKEVREELVLPLDPTDTTCYIDCLPDELLLRVFSFIPFQEFVSSICFVCKHWGQLSLDGSLWKEFCRKEHNCAPSQQVSTDWVVHFKFIYQYERKNQTLGGGSHASPTPYMLNNKDRKYQLSMEIKLLNGSIGSFQTVKHLIDHGVDVNEKTVTGSSALHTAAEIGSPEIVAYLITVGGADVNSVNITGDSPLHFACRLKTCFYYFFL